MLDSLSEGMIHLDREGDCRFVNRAAAQMLGYAPEEMIGQNAHRLFHSRYPDGTSYPETECPNTRAAREGQEYHSDAEVFWRRDGTPLFVRLNSNPIRDDTGQLQGAVVTFTDVTALRQTEAEMQRLQAIHEGQSRLLEMAHRSALNILGSRTGREALKHIVESACALVNARYGALGVARPDGQGLADFITFGLTPEEEEAIGSLPRGAGLLRLLLQRQEALRLDNITDHPDSVGFPPHHPVMGSFLGVPIRVGETTLGSLYLTEKEGGGPFTEADVAAVQALGAHAAVAIRNLQMLARQRALVNGLLAAQEEERRAVAYDLHDGLTQYVMGSYAHLETFRDLFIAGQATEALEELDMGMHYLDKAVLESRRLVNGLRSLALDDMGLAGALEQLLNEEKARAGWMQVSISHNIAGRRFDLGLETALYRVAQEALTNARKHAQATWVQVALHAADSGQMGRPTLTLTVQDGGKGFMPEEPSSDYSHIGLHGIAERVRLMDGEWTIESVPGQGTTLHAVFPIREGVTT